MFEEKIIKNFLGIRCPTLYNTGAYLVDVLLKMGSSSLASVVDDLR
jgi:hypothetical protein